MFEWDENKRRLNVEKHGVDFYDAVRIFEGPIVEAEDKRRDHGEQRFRVLGAIGQDLLFVVYTPRGPARRIISARRASHEEAAAYHAYLRRRRQAGERKD